MPRVASLYLPFLATERIARAGRGQRPQPEALPAGGGGAAKPADAGERSATTGWRPGARWARAERVAQVEADIAALPLHQRPQMRELGRRSEAAAIPFRAMPPDEAGRPRHRPSDPSLNPDGGAALRHAFRSNDAAANEASGLPLRQMVRDFPTIPERGRSDRDAGGTRRTPRAGGYEREGAFWQSAHAIAGEVRHGWDDPAAAAPRGAVPSGPAPCVTALRDGARLVIGAACPAAQGLGLAAGQPLATARALVPGLDVRDADPEGDAAFLHRLAVHAVRHWSPVAAPGDADSGGAGGLWIEASAAPLFGGEAGLARRILRALRRIGHDARIAIADTPGAAHALARFGAQRVTICPPGGTAAALADLPVAALRLDEKVASRLRRLGLPNVAALAAVPRAPLVRRFGSALSHRLDQALGGRAEPIEGVLPPDIPAVRCGFLEPIATAEAIATALAKLIGELCALLATRGLGARRVAMLCRRVDGGDASATIGTAAATRDPLHLDRLLRATIETIDPGFGIEAMRLIAPRCDRLDPQALHTLDAPEPDLATLVDILATRLGGARLYRSGGIESDVPERSIVPVAALHPAAAPPAAWPRPVRLLARPEPLAQVMAGLPDHPPIRFAWRGTLHRVAHGDGPERIHGEWWRATAEADAVRDYFAVEDEAGRRFWLFRRGDGVDGRTGDMSWHLHGLFAI